MTALRFDLLALPSRVIGHARWLIIRVGCRAKALASIAPARQTIRQLACPPDG